MVSNKEIIMTKKMTITLEESLLEELSELATITGKKKTQVIREALQDYFDTESVIKRVQEYKTVSHKDLRNTLGL